MGGVLIWMVVVGAGRAKAMVRYKEWLGGERWSEVQEKRDERYERGYMKKVQSPNEAYSNAGGKRGRRGVWSICI